MTDKELKKICIEIVDTSIKLRKLEQQLNIDEKLPEGHQNKLSDKSYIKLVAEIEVLKGKKTGLENLVINN